MNDGGSEQSPRSLRGAAARRGASLVGLVRTRQEHALATFMFAALFIATWVIAYFWDTHRLTAIAIVAIVFAGTGAALLILRSQAAKTAPTPFAATIAEFERDRAALAGRAPPAAPPTP